MRQRLERKISFLCLFVYLFIFVIRISRFILFTFFGVFPPSPIRIRHSQVSGPRFTDTLLYPMLWIYTRCLKKQTGQSPRRLVDYLLIRCIICYPELKNLQNV